MSRRVRAAGLLLAALACAAVAASLASGYTESVDSRFGPLRPVVVAEQQIDSGAKLGSRRGPALGVRQVPERFLPPDHFSDPVEVAGRATAVPIPQGAYLTGTMLRVPGGRLRRPPRLSPALRPVEIEVSGAGALAGSMEAGDRVDVVVTSEPGVGGPGRTRLAARGVPLILLAEGPSRPGEEQAWIATLGLDRNQALDLIDAENFAREVRLLASEPK